MEYNVKKKAYKTKITKYLLGYSKKHQIEELKPNKLYKKFGFLDRKKTYVYFYNDSIFVFSPFNDIPFQDEKTAYIDSFLFCFAIYRSRLTKEYSFCYFPYGKISIDEKHDGYIKIMNSLDALFFLNLNKLVKEDIDKDDYTAYQCFLNRLKNKSFFNK